jgi:phosphinothricin acetyltransferase
MIVISRERDQTIMIGDDILVTVVDIRGDKVRLQVEAPKELSVHRKEVYDAIRRESQWWQRRGATAAGLERQRSPSRGSIAIRPATADDLVAINDIYNWYVPRSTCTYQEIDEPIESRRKWFAEKIDEKFPVTVAVLDGDVVGWGALGTYRERSAYRFTVENSVYVRHDMHRRGIGAALLKDQIERAKSRGYKTIIAGIDAEQTASVAIHRKFGFAECGRQKAVGYKFGRWLDVVFMQLML